MRGGEGLQALSTHRAFTAPSFSLAASLTRLIFGRRTLLLSPFSLSSASELTIDSPPKEAANRSTLLLTRPANELRSHSPLAVLASSSGMIDRLNRCFQSLFFLRIFTALKWGGVDK